MADRELNQEPLHTSVVASEEEAYRFLTDVMHGTRTVGTASREMPQHRSDHVSPGKLRAKIAEEGIPPLQTGI